jgi:hypothetical protein
MEIMKNLHKKTLSSNNIFDLIDDKSSLSIEGGVGSNNYQSDFREQKEHEIFWQKVTSMLDDLI